MMNQLEGPPGCVTSALLVLLIVLGVAAALWA
jgi:hypothetical protein